MKCLIPFIMFSANLSAMMISYDSEAIESVDSRLDNIIENVVNIITDPTCNPSFCLYEIYEDAVECKFILDYGPMPKKIDLNMGE